MIADLIPVYIILIVCAFGIYKCLMEIRSIKGLLQWLFDEVIKDRIVDGVIPEQPKDKP